MQLHEAHCALCGPSGGKREKFPANFTEEDFNAATFSARRIPDRRHLRLVECTRCGMIFSDPVCSPGDLAHLYREGGVTYDNQEVEIYESYAAVLDSVLPRVRGRNRFVEIGGGRGFMLRWGVERGFSEQVEIEPSADAAQRFEPASASSTFTQGIFSADLVQEASADLVCFFQVLDHVPQPREFLQGVYHALAPGGAVVCVTHNTQALSARCLGERSPIFDIEHTYLFAPDNLSSLLRTVGFCGVDAWPIANNYSARYWARLFPIPRGMRNVATKVLERTGIGNVRLRLRAGNFAAVGIKPGR